jgi:hypothetical protein
MNLKRYGFPTQTEDGGDRRDPSDLIIRGKFGHVYQHSETMLGVATKTHGRAARQLAAMPGVTVLQNGTDGINAIFLPDLLDQVDAVVQLRRRRVLTESHKAKLAAANAPYRFRASKRDSSEPGIAAAV